MIKRNVYQSLNKVITNLSWAFIQGTGIYRATRRNRIKVAAGSMQIALETAWRDVSTLLTHCWLLLSTKPPAGEEGRHSSIRGRGRDFLKLPSIWLVWIAIPAVPIRRIGTDFFTLLYMSSNRGSFCRLMLSNFYISTSGISTPLKSLNRENNYLTGQSSFLLIISTI